MVGVLLLAAACVIVLGLIVLGLVLGTVVARQSPRQSHGPAPAPAGFAVRRPLAVLVVLAAGSLVAGLTGVVVATAPQAHAAPVIKTETVRYGPLLLPPHLGPSHGHDDGGDGHGGGGHGGEGHAGHHGQQMIYVAPTYDMPCENCYITGVHPRMVYANGESANYHTGAMLHHVVVVDPAKADTTCGRDGIALVSGERVFGVGNERTGADLPAGYGYHLGDQPLWAMAELMNMSAYPQQVYVEMDISYVDDPGAELKKVTPIWLDINNCGDSQYTIPAGESNTTWTWTSTVSGDIVLVAGHVHDHGLGITLSNRTRDEEICRSVAGYGTNPDYMGHIESMGVCAGDPVLARVNRGDVLMIDSHYHSPAEDSTVMGIMLAFLHEN